MFSKTTVALTKVDETNISTHPEIQDILAEMPFEETQELVHLVATTESNTTLILTVLADLYRNPGRNMQCYAFRAKPWLIQPCTFQRLRTEKGVRYQLI